MHRRRADRVEETPACGTCEAAEAHRRVRHAECRQADLRNGFAERARHDTERVQVGGLALIGRHARGGVALDVLDGVEPLAGCEQQVARRDIVLPVDEGPPACRGCPGQGALQVPGCWCRRRCDGNCCGCRRGTQRDVRRADAAACGIDGLARCGRARRRSIGKNRSEREHTAAAPGAAHTLGGGARDERLQGIVPLQLATRLREEVHARGVAARHQNAVAGLQLRGGGLAAFELRQLNGAHAPSPARAEHRGAGQHGNARFTGAGRHRRVSGAHIGDRSDEYAGTLQLERHRVSLVGCGDDNGARTRAHAVAVEKCAGCARQQDPGPVVAREDQRALDRPGREHHFAGAHLPLPLARPVRRRDGEVVGEALVETHEVMGEIAERRRARKQRDARVGGERGDRARQPVGRRPPLDKGIGVRIAGKQCPPELRLLIAQDDARAGGGRSGGGGKSRGTCADHEDVAMRVTRGVAIGVCRPRRYAEARGCADARLVERLPRAARPHEGLVVEARGDEGRHQIVDGTDIEREARPAVLALRHEAVVELELRGAHVRGAARRIPAHTHERIGFLGARGQHAPRPVILEGAAEQMHAVGQQR